MLNQIELGASWLMDIGKILEKLKNWVNRVLDSLLGPSAQPEPEAIPIPVPVNDRRRR
ncbi:hypothetical protein [Leptothoe kymatousa]|nr:hypothetical protein [Leptothoe kymatousa]